MVFSAAAVAATVAVCLWVLPMHPATVALLLLLTVLVVSSRWGFMEAVVVTVLGSLCLAYYFLPPQGWGVGGIEHQVAWVTFVVVALATGNLAAREHNQAIREKDRRLEAERLYSLAQALSANDQTDSIISEIPDLVVKTFGLEAAAFYDLRAGKAHHAGTDEHTISEEQLRSWALGLALETPGAHLARVTVEGQPIGSLWAAGNLPAHVFALIVERLEIRLERTAAIEKHNEAEALRKSHELGAALLDSLLHEIKTPLSVIKTAASSLLSRDWNGAGKEEMLALINEEIDHLDTSVNEVFWTAHAKSGKLQPEIGPHDIRRLVAASLAELKSRVDTRPVHLDVPEFLPSANFDFQMVKVVFKELMNNALKFSPDGSPVSVAVQLAQSEIITSVRDSGIGIAPGEENRVFEKHYRGKVTSAGMGLGLAFAKTIVEAHGGHIGATRRPGGGSVFYFSLPVSQPRAA
jgi:two-component system, OmpR family, sensor histidine kinase KdpD